MTTEKEFNYSVELFGKHVSDHVKVIEPSSLKVPLLFRVDERLPKTFIARMPKSAAPSENSTVPRIVTATTLLGCMCGNAAMVWLITTRQKGETGNNFYYISAFDFDYALLPDRSLVFDAEDTEEAWLITYNKETIEYRAMPYAELFFHKVTTIIKGNSLLNTLIGNILLKIDDPRGLPIAKDLFLKKGFYYIKMDLTHYSQASKEHRVTGMTFKDGDKLDITPISASVYKSFYDISVKR